MMPVALQSLVQKIIKVLEDKEAIAHPAASEEGCKVGRLALPSILKKRKVRARGKREGSPGAESTFDLQLRGTRREIRCEVPPFTSIFHPRPGTGNLAQRMGGASRERN